MLPASPATVAAAAPARLEFCVGGPPIKGINYMLDVTKLDAGRETVDVNSLFHFNECLEHIRMLKYFTVHGPRQSMKVFMVVCIVGPVRFSFATFLFVSFADFVFASIAASYQFE